MIQIARAAALVAVLTALPASAQALDGTWFEAKLTARMLVDAPDPAPGDPAPSFGGVAPRLLVKDRAYLRVEVYGGAYLLSTWVESAEGLLETGQIAFLEVAEGGVSRLSVDLPIVGTAADGFADVGIVSLHVVGKLRVKVDGQGALKAARFTSVGGRAEGLLDVDGAASDVYGAPKLRLKSVPESALPPLADVPGGPK